MRFKCSTCNGVFFLETTKPIPCPACMSMLEVAEDAPAPAQAASEVTSEIPAAAAAEATSQEDDDLNFDAMLAALNEPAETISLDSDSGIDETIALPSELFSQMDSSETAVVEGVTREIPASELPADDTIGSEGVTQEINAADLHVPDAFAEGVEAALSPVGDETTTLPSLGVPAPADTSGSESATVTLPRVAPPPPLGGQGGVATVTLPSPSQQPTLGPTSTQVFPPPSPTQSGSIPKLPEGMDDLAFFNSETVEIKQPPGAITGSWPVPPRPSSRRFATSPGITQPIRPPTTSWSTASISGRMPSTRATNPMIRIPHYQRSGVQAWHLWVAGGVGATLLAVTVFSYYLRTQGLQKPDSLADSSLDATFVQPSDSSGTGSVEYSAETSAAIADANRALEAALAAIEAEPDLAPLDGLAALPTDADLDLPGDAQLGDADDAKTASLSDEPGDTSTELASLDAPGDLEAIDTVEPDGLDRPDGDVASAAAAGTASPIDAEGEGTASVQVEPDRVVFEPEERGEAYRDRMVERFATETVAEIEPSRLDKAILFELASGRHQVDLNVSPDGTMEITAKRPSAHVLVEGAKGNSADVFLKAGERISVRPAASAVVAMLDGRLMLNVTTTNWSFSVEADDVRPNGLPVLCDDMACILKPGSSLTTERLFSKVTFAVSDGGDHPKLVRLLVDSSQEKEQGKPAAGAVAMNTGTKRPKRVSRGVFDGRSRDFAWQSVALPTLDR
jgi:hypothetical protein